MNCFSVLHNKHVWVAQMHLSVFKKVLCARLFLSMHCIKQISHSHRSAAIAVWRALRRRRLHDDVGHVNGELSGLLGQLKAREENITGSVLLSGPLLIHTSLFVSLHYTHMNTCAHVCVPCRSPAGP